MLGNFGVSLLNDIGIGALVALGLVLLTGIGGATSFGQAAFVGIAAYATAWLTTVHGASPWLGLLFALALTGVAALAIGLLTLRLGGHFLPLSTIAWGLSIALLFGNMDSLGRHTGMSNIPPLRIGAWSLVDARAMYYLVWSLVGLACLFCYNVLQSRAGRAIRALRGGAILLGSVGADAFRVRLMLFVWLRCRGARGLALCPHEPLRQSLALRRSRRIEYLLMAVAGGLGHLSGALVGSALVLILKNGLQDLLPQLRSAAASSRRGVRDPVHRAAAPGARRADGIRAPLDPRPLRAAAGSRAGYDDGPLPHRALPVTGAPVLAVTGAVKRFGGLIAVNDVSFEVRAGEIVGLIGPNGAGKSTMFNLVTGTLPMTAGRVEFLGAQHHRPIAAAHRPAGHRTHLPACQAAAAHEPARQRGAGRACRGHAGLIAAGMRLDRREEAQIRAEALRELTRLGLAGRAHELAGSLPLGTQRILEIARALASDPVLLVLDEPAAGLRRKEKRALAELLRKLRGEGVTILIVEHDMDFVMKLVDRLVVMTFGSKLVEGTPAAVRANAEVQTAYLGSVVEAPAACPRGAGRYRGEGGEPRVRRLSTAARRAEVTQ